MKTGWTKSKLSKIKIEEGALPLRVGSDSSYGISAVYTAQISGDILVIDIFRDDLKGLMLRHFIDKNKNRWLSLTSDHRWSTATLERINYQVDRKFFSTRHTRPWRECDEQAIDEYLGIDDHSGIRKVEHYQKSVLSGKLKGKHEKEKAKIDAELEGIDNTPVGFEKWVDESVLKDYRYVFYEYTGKKDQSGFCTHCRQSVVVNGAKHNEKGICPSCGSAITYKAKRKSAPIGINKRAAVLCNVTGKDKIALRIFYVNRYISKYAQEIKTKIEESHRVLFSMDFRKYREYYYGEFKQTRETRWCRDGDGARIYCPIYPENTTPLLQSVARTGAQEMISSGVDVCLMAHVDYYKTMPQIEYLVKSGLYNLTKDLITRRAYVWSRLDQFDESAKNLTGFLKLSAEGVARCKKYDFGVQEVTFLQELHEKGGRVSDEELEQIIKEDRFSSSLAWILAKGVSLAKLDRYISSQKKIHHRAYTTTYYSDYLNMCEKLGYDLKNGFVKYPKNLYAAHDEAAKRIKQEKSKIVNQKIESMHEETERIYGMQFDGYLIRAPKNAKDLADEGHALHHCVSSYAENIADRKTVVLFIRESAHPDKPFATMEVSQGRIRQVRGKNNKDYTADLKKFLNKFKSEKGLSI